MTHILEYFFLFEWVKQKKKTKNFVFSYHLPLNKIRNNNRFEIKVLPFLVFILYCIRERTKQY